MEQNNTKHLSNEQNIPRLFRVFLGDAILSRYIMGI